MRFEFEPTLPPLRWLYNIHFVSVWGKMSHVEYEPWEVVEKFVWESEKVFSIFWYSQTCSQDTKA